MQYAIKPAIPKPLSIAEMIAAHPAAFTASEQFLRAERYAKAVGA